jgi:hypothetical protein
VEQLQIQVNNLIYIFCRAKAVAFAFFYPLYKIKVIVTL